MRGRDSEKKEDMKIMRRVKRKDEKVQKSIDMITDIAEDSEKYIKFYEQFSKNLKVSLNG